MSGVVQRGRAIQHGAAAVEFAFVLPVLMLILWGMATLGTVLYAQLSLSRAAADGARALGTVNGVSGYGSVSAGVKSTIRLQVVQSLAQSLLSAGTQGSFDGRVSWLEQNVLPNITVDNLTCAGGQPSDEVLRVRVAYPYSSVRILPQISLPLVGSMDAWMPDTLTGCATVRL